MAEGTPTPPVGLERGEWSYTRDEIVSMARFKPGFGTATASGTTSAQTVTLNNASGVITTGAMSIGQDLLGTITMTNNKVQAGDAVFAMMDGTGATPNSVPVIASVQVTAGQVVFNLSSLSSTSSLTALSFYFMVATKGNPN